MSARFDMRVTGLLGRWLPRVALLAATGLAHPALASFTQAFSPATVAPDTAALLTFTIQNQGATPLTGASFSNVLPAGMTLATPALASNTCGGMLTAVDGGTTISLSSGAVAVGESCTVSAYVVGTTPASLTNPSVALTSSSGSEGSNTATLTVNAARPTFSAAYSPASAHWRDRVVLTYTVDNSANAALSIFGFTDVLPVGLALADPANASSTCTAGTLVASPGSRAISFTNAVVPATSSCTVAVEVFADAVGSFAHASSVLTAQIPANATSGVALAALEVLPESVSVSQRFELNPAIPGEQASVRFRIVNTSRTDSATGLSFTHDLGAALSGLVATALPLSNVCGSGSSLSGSGVLTLSGGSLAPGSSCEFSVPLQLPAGATPGSYPSTTSNLTGSLGSSGFSSNPATDFLHVQAVPLLTKQFAAPVVGSGQSITLTYTVANTSTTDTLSFSFVDNYGDLVSTVATVQGGLGLCGGTVSAQAAFSTEPARLVGSSLSLAPGASCSFDVSVPITAGVRTGRFSTVTQSASGTVGASTLNARVTEDFVSVVSPPALALEVVEDFVAAGQTATLDVVLSNDSMGQIDADEYDNFSDLAFTLDLNAVLPGLSAVGLPTSNVCGGGSQLTGTSILALTGGVLGEGQSCSFSVPLAVPALADSRIYTLVSSEPSGVARGVTTLGAPASTTMIVGGLSATQEFIDDPVAPGGTATLRFTLLNNSETETATLIGFTESFSSVMSGLVATGLPRVDVCGAGSSLSGTGSISLSNASLLPGASCTFDIALTVPAGAMPGNYLSSADSVRATFSGGQIMFASVTDVLKVEIPGEPRDLSGVNLDEPDPDGDGVSTDVEQSLGDVNGDGILDALQPNVASLISPVTGRPVALSVGGACDQIRSFTIVSAESLGVADGDVRYPEGLASFDLECASAEVTLWFPGADFSGPMAIRKFGPVAPDFGGPSRWYAVQGGAIDRSAATIRFSVVDGGLGDSTGVDGHIVDPVGAAFLTVNQIPSLSPAALMMLLAAVAVFGGATLRRAYRPEGR